MSKINRNTFWKFVRNILIHLFALLLIIGLYIINHTPLDLSIPGDYPNGVYHCIVTVTGIMGNEKVTFTDREWYIEFVDIKEVKLTHIVPIPFVGYASWNYDKKDRRLSILREKFKLVDPDTLIQEYSRVKCEKEKNI